MTFGYFKLQLKRAAVLYPAIIAMTLFLALCIAGAGSLILLKSDSNDESSQKMQIGITGDVSHSYLEVGIAAIQNLDASRFSIDFITMEEEEAKSMLISGELSGYIRIPDGFVDAVMQMENIPVTYVTLNRPVGFGSILMDEVTRTVAEIVNYSQKGLFGLYNLAKENEANKNIGKATDELNIEYIEHVLTRTEMFEIEYVGMADGISGGGYFVCGGIMIFLLLWGISCNSILMKKDRSMDRLLTSKGQSVISQTASELAAYFTVTLVTFLLFAALAGGVLQFIECGIPELDNAFFSDYLLFIVNIIPVLLMVTVLQLLFYEAVSGTVSVILLQFIFAIGTGYICGCLYPSHFFPVTVQNIAAVLPTGVGVRFLRQCISSSLSLASFLSVTAYALAFFALLCALRKYRTAGKEA